MTLVVLIGLGAGWLLYLALWFRESRSTTSQRPESMISFSSALGALAAPARRPRFSTAGRSRRPRSGAGVVVPFSSSQSRYVRQSGWREAPRSRAAAMQRRRVVGAVLVALVAASFFAIPTFGTAAVAASVAAAVLLAAFGVGIAFRRAQPQGLQVVGSGPLAAGHQPDLSRALAQLESAPLVSAKAQFDESLVAASNVTVLRPRPSDDEIGVVLPLRRVAEG